MMEEPADAMMEGGNPDISLLDADDTVIEPQVEKPFFVTTIVPCLKKIGELLLGLALLALYVFYVIKTADFFHYCLAYNYGFIFVMTCVFITMQMFFVDPEKIFASAVLQLMFIPFIVWAYMYETEKFIATVTSKWTWSIVVSIMQAPTVFGIHELPGFAKCGGFLCCLFAGPYIWYYALFPAAYYVLYIPAYYVIVFPLYYLGLYLIIVPIYFVGYFLLYLVPYYILYVPGKFIAFYVVELYNYLCTIGILVSFVKTVVTTVLGVVKAPLHEFVFKPLAFVFGQEEAKYALFLIIVPFVLVMICALVNKISKACKKSDKVKTA